MIPTAVVSLSGERREGRKRKRKREKEGEKEEEGGESWDKQVGHDKAHSFDTSQVVYSCDHHHILPTHLLLLILHLPFTPKGSQQN